MPTIGKFDAILVAMYFGNDAKGADRALTMH